LIPIRRFGGVGSTLRSPGTRYDGGLFVSGLLQCAS